LERFDNMGKNNNITTDKNESIFDIKNISDPDIKVSELFFDFTEWYRGQYNISKSVLVLKSMSDYSLSAVSTWENGAKRDGLTIRLPLEHSLFEKVINEGKTYLSQLSDDFTGNFFEKKLLMNENTRSFVLQPLKCKDDVIGLIGFSSESSDIFNEEKQSLFEETSVKLAEVIREKLINF